MPRSRINATDNKTHVPEIQTRNSSRVGESSKDHDRAAFRTRWIAGDDAESVGGASRTVALCCSIDAGKTEPTRFDATVTGTSSPEFVNEKGAARTQEKTPVGLLHNGGMRHFTNKRAHSK